MKIEELKKFYIEQMERIGGALARKFDQKTLNSWWADGVKKYGYKAKDIEYAATKLNESDDAFPILSTFIYYCSTGRRERQRAEKLKERRQEEGSKDLSMTGILAQGAKTAQGKKARAAIINTQNFLTNKIDRATWAKRQEEIEKGEG